MGKRIRAKEITPLAVGDIVKFRKYYKPGMIVDDVEVFPEMIFEGELEIESINKQGGYKLSQGEYLYPRGMLAAVNAIRSLNR